MIYVENIISSIPRVHSALLLIGSNYSCFCSFETIFYCIMASFLVDPVVCHRVRGIIHTSSYATCGARLLCGTAYRMTTRRPARRLMKMKSARCPGLDVRHQSSGKLVQGSCTISALCFALDDVHQRDVELRVKVDGIIYVTSRSRTIYGNGGNL
jgi:hypothetical protein